MSSDNKEKKGKEILLKVPMHCEGCAAEVSSCLKGFEGVEEVKTDTKGDKVIVKGEKADPLKVLERVKKKFSRNSELIYPIPKPKSDDKKEPPKKQENPIKVVVLKMYMHCEGCANDIQKTIERMKGILNVEPDMKKSTVTIKGDFDPQKLVQTITKQMGKYVEIVENENKGNEIGKGEGEGNKKVKKEEIIFQFQYPPQYSAQHIYPTQIFSDENIFSCSVM